MSSAGTSMQAPFSIGTVLAQLQSEFPDITISKIRFLEAEGLLTPQRTASGYRKFSPADVARLRYVLAAQRDCYLPLRVIKEQLDAVAGEAALPALPMPAEEAALPVRAPVNDELSSAIVDAGIADEINVPMPEDFHLGQSSGRLSRSDLSAASGLSEVDLRQLEQFGLLPRISQDGSYDSNAVLIADTVSRLAVFGIEPRHLRTFQSAAEREVALLEQIIAPMRRQRSSSGRERTAEVACELAALVTRLHMGLVRTVLHKSMLSAR